MIALAGITQSIKEGVKMKPIHFHISYCKRSAGRSVIEYASYCSGESLLSQYNGVRYYKERDDVVYKEILLPPNAPDDYQNREILWNSVELYEDKNAQLARLIDVALPNEINREDQINLIRDYVQQVFVAEGMCADVAVHDKGTGNPHAHIILTLRSLDENGNWKSKWIKNYRLDDQGRKIYDPVTKRYQCGPSIPVNHWGNKANAEIWRRLWAETCNCVLKSRDIKVRYSNLSYVRLGIDREPQKHLGRNVLALEARGYHTDRGLENRRIIERNQEREKPSRLKERDDSWERSR